MKQDSIETRPMVAVVVDSLERARFFLRVAHSAQALASLLFLTSEPIAHVRLIAAGYHSVYLHRTLIIARTEQSTGALPRIETAIEVLNGDISRERASKDATAIIKIATAAFRKFGVSSCLIWNGQQLLGLAVGYVCEELNIPVRFLEISNLPSKLFVDNRGVNARSSIANEPALLDRLDLPAPAQHQAWLSEYEAYKAKPVPQAANAGLRRLTSKVNFLLKTLTMGVARRKPIRVARHDDIRKQVGQRLSERDLRASAYLFLPLQVSGDTQIKLNSSVDNLEAIRIAHRMALEENLRLLVKMHPAEQDSASLADVVALSQDLEFDIVENSTTDLLRGAQKVVTINSTVGLEALLYGKPVVCLGRALYAAFDEARLLKYIHQFLIADIDYFGAAPIPESAVCRLLRLSPQ
jgi:capsular polysaccharide export protein